MSGRTVAYALFCTYFSDYVPNYANKNHNNQIPLSVFNHWKFRADVYRDQIGFMIIYWVKKHNKVKQDRLTHGTYMMSK